MLNYDPLHTASFYDRYGEQEVARWQKDARTRFECAVYRHHLTERVRPGMRVLDAGCGPGTFAKGLIERGVRVTCLDISEVQLDACRRLAPGAEAYILGTVADLSQFPDSVFDVSLALGGPVSYCLDRGLDAVRELSRVTIPGGWVGISVMSLYGTVHRFLPGILTLPMAVNREILRSGDLSRTVNDGHECHMYRVEELRALLREVPLENIQLSASGWLVPNGEFDLPDEGSEAWKMLLEAEIEASADTPGAGTHIIAWAQRGRT